MGTLYPGPLSNLLLDASPVELFCRLRKRRPVAGSVEQALRSPASVERTGAASPVETAHNQFNVPMMLVNCSWLIVPALATTCVCLLHGRYAAGRRTVAHHAQDLGDVVDGRARHHHLRARVNMLPPELALVLVHQSRLLRVQDDEQAFLDGLPGEVLVHRLHRAKALYQRSHRGYQQSAAELPIVACCQRPALSRT